MSSNRKMRRRNKAPRTLLQVVHGPLEQPWLARLSQETRDALPRLHALVHDDPPAAVAELRAWIEREPLPMFYNWLSTAFSALGDTAGAEQTVRENYRQNPQYLFARVNYAELCLRDGDLPGAREALGESLDIRPLLGGRKRAHVTEVAGYFFAVGLYHLKAGDRDAAEKIHEMMDEVAPGTRPTEELRRLLRPRLRDLFSR